MKEKIQNSCSVLNLDRRHVQMMQGPSTESSMRRRIFAGMKSLTGFGSRSRHGSPSHRSISLPESTRIFFGASYQ